jgi:hypothetical protein
MEPHDDPASANAEGQWLRNGAAFEAAGLMTQADYVRLAHLSRDIVAGDGSIADADLDWALALLAQATEAVVRSKVMVMLSVLGHRTPLPPAQQERIMAAVAPFAESEHKLDQLSAARALRATGSRIRGCLRPPSEN